MKMYDLIYGPEEWFQEILEKFPDAKFEDARDYLHEDRFAVRIPTIEDTLGEEWLHALLDLGMIEYSFCFQLACHDKEMKDKLKEICTSYKNKKADNSK